MCTNKVPRDTGFFAKAEIVFKSQENKIEYIRTYISLYPGGDGLRIIVEEPHFGMNGPTRPE